MIKNDEDYLIRRTYTNYGGRKMSADEMMFKTEYNKKEQYEEKGKIKNEKFRGSVYDYVNFNHTTKCVYISGSINMQTLQAINKKVEELGWNE